MKAAGFTLLELVLALAVAGSVVAIATGAVVYLTERVEAVEAAATERTGDATVRHDLVRWLADAVAIDDGMSFRGLDGEWRGRPDDELSFMTVAPTPLPSRYTAVRIFVDRDPATPEAGLVAELAAWPSGARTRMELEATIQELNAVYLSDWDGTPRTNTWSSRWLPAAVEMHLGGANTAGLLTLPIVVSPGERR